MSPTRRQSTSLQSHAPSVATGETTVLPGATSPRNRSGGGLLGPWLAAGLGLAVLATVPNDGATVPAGASPPQQLAAPAEGATLRLADALPPLDLARPGRGTGTPSFESLLDLGVMSEVQRTRTEAPVTTFAHEFTATAAEPPVWASRSFGVAAPSPVGSEQPTAEQWAALRFCESSNDYRVVNDSGKYRGGYQFDRATWESVGGSGDPAAATPDEQDLRARLLFEARGSAPWPFCGRYLDQPVSDPEL